MDFGALLKGPSRAHLLGTDQFGRDVLARLVWGARLSVSIGAVAVALALVVGVPIGALSGYAGGAVDNVLMRCMDALLAFPALLLALGLVAIMGPGSTSTTLAIGIVYTPGVARLTRGVVLAERPQEYVSGRPRARPARPLGAGAPHHAELRVRAAGPGQRQLRQRDGHRGGAVVPRHRHAAADRRAGG